jgi:hypothetical protein
MDRKMLIRYQNKILVGLVDFFYLSGYKEKAYMDPKTGGILENKLESRVGLQTGSVSPSAEFLLATQMLETKGYVRRTQPSPDSSLLVIWPTNLGLERAEYLKASRIKKILLFFTDNGKSIIVSAITTVVTLFIAWLFKLFGLG